MAINIAVRQRYSKAAAESVLSTLRAPGLGPQALTDAADQCLPRTRKHLREYFVHCVHRTKNGACFAPPHSLVPNDSFVPTPPDAQGQIPPHGKRQLLAHAAHLQNVRALFECRRACLCGFTCARTCA